MNVQTSRRDDHALLAATKTQIAFGVDFAQVSSAQPAFLIGGTKFTLFPIAAGNVFTADENFAIFGELEFAARQYLANGPLRCAKRVIQADERSRLRHAVTLNNGIAQKLEKVFSFVRKGCAARNGRPEFPAKAPVDLAKHPGALEKFSTFCIFESSLQPLRFPLAFEFSLDTCMKEIEHPRNGDKRRGSLLLDAAYNLRGIARRFENDRGPKQRRNKQRHKLSEHVAQRNERDESQRAKPKLIFPVLFDAAFQRLKVCQKISVRQNNSTWLSRRAGCVKNFGNSASRETIARFYGSIWSRLRASRKIFEIIDDHRRG